MEQHNQVNGLTQYYAENNGHINPSYDHGMLNNNYKMGGKDTRPDYQQATGHNKR